MQPRERFIAALERRPITGLVPHFELVFFLTMEAFGKVHPSHRYYSQWGQMEEKERALHRSEMADIYIATAERYGHSAIFIHPNPDTVEETLYLVDLIRERTGDRYYIMRHGDATFSIPSGSEMMAFAERLAFEFTFAVEKHRQGFAHARLIIRKLLALQQRLQALQALVFHRFGNLAVVG